MESAPKTFEIPTKTRLDRNRELPVPNGPRLVHRLAKVDIELAVSLENERA